MALEEDRISSIPDCILVEILSLLDETKYAIRTGTLSKRWQHLWPQLSNLLFNHISSVNTRQFYSSLERILSSQTHQLNKLKLDAFYVDGTHTQLCNCIRNAITRNVKEVDLDIHHKYFFDRTEDRRFVLPDFFFTSSSFICISLCECSFKLADVISWENLRTLRIYASEIDNDMFENILAGSPLLETLELIRCYGFDRIDITTNKSVKNLGLFRLYGCGGDPIIQINAPSILSLAITGDLKLNEFMLLNVSSLIKVELNIFKKSVYPPVDVQETHEEQETNEAMLFGHLLKIAHVKEVKLGQLCLETFARLKAKGFIVPSNWKGLREIA